MFYIGQIVVANSHHGIKLEWEESIAIDFSHFTIEMSNKLDGEYFEIGNTSQNKFITPALEGKRNYYFIVYSWDLSGNRSKVSNKIKVST